MKIYQRDYSKLTEEEKNVWESIKEKEKIYSNGKELSFRKNLFNEYPEAIRHYLSIFPNNYLDIEELSNEGKLKDLIEKYECILDNPSINEMDILKHIKDTQSYFIIASIIKSNFNFGHHSAYIFPEFMLGVNKRADYLIVGKNSGGYEFIFVELEKPYGRIVTKDGDLGEVFRKGINQVKDWNRWIESNFTMLKDTFEKYTHSGEQMPREFTELDKTRIHYVVVAGRRKNFTDKTYRIKREYMKNEKILLIHFDNLGDYSKDLIGKATY